MQSLSYTVCCPAYTFSIKEFDAFSGEITLSKAFCYPSEKEFILKEKTLFSLGWNGPFSEGAWLQENKHEVINKAVKSLLPKIAGKKKHKKKKKKKKKKKITKCISMLQ